MFTYVPAEQFKASQLEPERAYPAAHPVQADVCPESITVEHVVHVAGHDKHSPVCMFKYVPKPQTFKAHEFPTLLYAGAHVVQAALSEHC